MLKNLSKKISMVLICTSLVVANAMPVFASTNASANILATKATVTGIPLVDGQTSYSVISGVGQYSISVKDNGMRYFTIASASKVKATLTANGKESLINISTQTYRDNMTVISTNLIAGYSYVLKVDPETKGSNVTVSMSRGSTPNYVYIGTGTTSQEKNLLLGQNTDEYDFGFQQGGTYSISVSSNMSSCYLTLVGGGQNIVNRPIPPFTAAKPYPLGTVVVGASQITSCRLLLMNHGDTANNSSAYTVTITKN